MEILGHQAATASDKGHRAEIEEIWQQTATAPANLRSAFWASDRIHTRQSIGNRAELGRSNWHCLNPPLAVAGTFWSYRTSRLRMNPPLAVAGTFLWDVPSAYESASAVAGTLFHDVPSAYESALAVAGISGLKLPRLSCLHPPRAVAGISGLKLPRLSCLRLRRRVSPTPPRAS